MLIRFAVCAAMGAARLGELAFSRRNIAEAGPTTEGEWSRRTYPLMVLLHTVVIVGTFLAGRDRPSRFWLTVLLAVQPLRAWVIFTLGRRWNTRAAVPEQMDLVTSGPYRFIRHPNYTVVSVELLALPLAFGLPLLAAFASIANAALLALRIPEEETLLQRIPGYEPHFRDLPRFVPRLF